MPSVFQTTMFITNQQLNYYIFTQILNLIDPIDLVDINTHEILFYWAHALDGILILAYKKVVVKWMLSTDHLLKLSASPMEFVRSRVHNPCSSGLTVQAPDMLCVVVVHKTNGQESFHQQ